MRRADLPQVVRVRLDTQRTAYKGIFPQELLDRNSYEKLQARYERELFEQPDPPGTFGLVAEADGIIVGMLIAGPEKDGSTQYTAEIHTIYVLQAYQGRGIGTALTVEAARHLKQTGFKALVVWVLEANDPSRAFYASLGAQVVRQETLEHDGYSLPVLAYGMEDMEPLLGRYNKTNISDCEVHMTASKTIGVVAGAGPFAGLDLLKKIFEQTLAVKDQDHLNVIGNFKSAELFDRTTYLLDPSLPNPGAAIASQILETEKLGASVAGIPCNTAHSPKIINKALEDLRAAGSQVVFVNMIQETVDYIKTVLPHCRCIGVLASTGTYRTRIYPDYLEPEGFTVLQPDEDEQRDLVHAAIYDPVYGIKAVGTGTERSRGDLLKAARLLIARGAQAVVLGCTEIPLAIPDKEIDGLPAIDPTLMLARALVRTADPSKLRPL